MKFLSTENKIHVGFGVAALVLLVVGFAAYLNISQSIETTAEAARIRGTIDRLVVILSNIRDVENAQRGYIITGREYYLSDFETSATNAEAAILVLQSQEGAHALQSAELDSLILLVRNRLEFARETIVLGRQSGLARARNEIMTDKGLQMTNAIRQHVSDLESRKRESLQNVKTLARERANQTVPFIIFSSAVAFIFLVLAMMVLRQDIAERKRLEAALQDRAEDLQRSNEDLERFAYVASHDLKEPLRMVSNFCQLLEQKYRESMDDEGKEYIRYSIEGTKRMQLLIDDLLAYARVGTRGNPFAHLDGNEVLKEILTNIRMMIDERKAVVTFDPLPVVYGDVVQIGQVLQNLITNAVKFQKKDSAPQVHVSAVRTSGEVVFSVRDNGIGIDPRHFGKLFNLFQRLHGREEYSGTGIGLAVCKRIIGRHKGRIWVESEPGKGSTFFFSLPDVSERQA